MKQIAPFFVLSSLSLASTTAFASGDGRRGPGDRADADHPDGRYRPAVPGRRVRNQGLPFILISHNMPRMFALADRIHIQRLGKGAALVNPKVISMSDTVAVMTGAKTVDELPSACLA